MRITRIGQCIKLVSALGLATVTLAIQPGNPVQAFITLGKWQTGNGIYYSINPNIDSNLGIAGSNSLITNNVMGQWNQATWFGYHYNSNYDSNSNGYTAVNFISQIPPGCSSYETDASPGVTCVEYSDSGNSIIRERTSFNTSSTYQWNTSGVMNSYTTPHQIDFLTVALHETGHWYSLDHDSQHTEAVMLPDQNVSKHSLQEDDKQGAVQIYGPRTGWEPNSGYARGEVNRQYYNRYVNGYNNSGSPELGPRTAEFSVPVFTGSTYEMIAGNATDLIYSYYYAQLFTSDNDNAPWWQQHNYLKITPGMKIRWYQYNLQQQTMGIDFEMTDGTTLRDSGLQDQNGIGAHPAARGAYGNGYWFYTNIDLTPLAGKVIRKWMIAYDNGRNGSQGNFRAYFDNFRVEY